MGRNGLKDFNGKINATLALAEPTLSKLECWGAMVSRAKGEAETLDTQVSLNRPQASAWDLHRKRFLGTQTAKAGVGSAALESL